MDMAPERGGWEARKPATQATVRCKMIPHHVGAAELSQHFVAFGKIVEMRLRAVTAEEGGKGEKEALVQFATARQAQACVSVRVSLLRVSMGGVRCAVKHVDRSEWPVSLTSGLANVTSPHSLVQTSSGRRQVVAVDNTSPQNWFPLQFSDSSFPRLVFLV